jgi:hypothetical protein
LVVDEDHFPSRSFLRYWRAAALATGAVATINSTVWLLAGSLSWWRLMVATIASVALVVAWLVVDGELWDRPDDNSPEARERSRLYNTFRRHRTASRCGPQPVSRSTRPSAEDRGNVQEMSRRKNLQRPRAGYGVSADSLIGQSTRMNVSLVSPFGRSLTKSCPAASR